LPIMELSFLMGVEIANCSAAAAELVVHLIIDHKPEKWAGCQWTKLSVDKMSWHLNIVCLKML
jgi:hypothetical protein